MSRNHVNVLSSDVVVALPGGPGTLSELRLARASALRRPRLGARPRDRPLTHHGAAASPEVVL